jgi:biopolymer transport protein ExbB
VQRRVSSRGRIQVARQRITVGMTHAGKIVTVICENNTFRLVIDAETVGVVSRTTSREIDRYKAYATRPRRR